MHHYDMKALMTGMAQIRVSKGRIGLKQNATHVQLSFWDSIFQAISYWYTSLFGHSQLKQHKS